MGQCDIPAGMRQPEQLHCGVHRVTLGNMEDEPIAGRFRSWTPVRTCEVRYGTDAGGRAVITGSVALAYTYDSGKALSNTVTGRVTTRRASA